MHVLTRFSLAAGVALCVAACGAPPEPVVVVPTAPLNTPTPAVRAPTYTVARGDVAEVLSLQGRVAAGREEEAFFAIDGILKQVYVEPEATVTVGQLLAELDTGELPEQLAQAQSTLASAEAELRVAEQQRGLRISEAQLGLQTAQTNLLRAQQPASRVAVSEARQGVEQALSNLESIRRTTSLAKTQAEANMMLAADAVRARQEEYAAVVARNGNRPLEELGGEERVAQEQAMRAISAAETNLNLARAAYDAALRNERESIMLAEKAITTAQVKLDTLLAGPDPLLVAEAQQAVAAAQLAVTAASSMVVSPALGQQVQDARRAVEAAEKAIEQTRLYAPLDGVVAVIDSKAGDRIEAYAPVVTVIDPARFDLRIDSTLGDSLPRISVGQPVTIMFARSDSPVSGTISALPGDDQASGRSSDATRVAFDPQGLELQIGDAANVTMVVREASNALWLPPQALWSFDQRPFVVLREGDGERQVDIEVGIVTSERVQITGGVREGDVVVGQGIDSR